MHLMLISCCFSHLTTLQAAQQMTIELSAEPEKRRQQLQLLKEYGYDVSAFE